jgi:hypothetical protein
MRHLFIWISVFLWPAWVFGAVVEGTTVTGEFEGVDTASVTCNASGSDRLMIGHLWFYPNTITVSSVQYGGTSMTQNAAIGFASADEIHQYRQVAPLTGSQSFAVAFSATLRGLLVCTPYTGVHQTTPVGTSVANSALSVTSRSAVVTSAAGELVIDTFAGLDDPTGLTIGGGQTQLFTVTNTVTGVLMRGSKEAGAPSVTMSWSWTNAQNGLIIGTPLKPVAVLAGSAAHRRRQQ